MLRAQKFVKPLCKNVHFSLIMFNLYFKVVTTLLSKWKVYQDQFLNESSVIIKFPINNETTAS